MRDELQILIDEWQEGWKRMKLGRIETLVLKLLSERKDHKHRISVFEDYAHDFLTHEVQRELYEKLNEVPNE